MSRIRNITVVPVAHALDAAKAYGMSRGLTAVRGAGIVRLQTEDGVEGIGEAWGPPGVTRAYLDIVRPLFVGASVFAQRGVAQKILAQHYHFGIQNAMVALLGGIDVAAHDAMGKLLNVSVADLIGGRQRERVPVYASGGYFTAADDQEHALEAQLDAVRHHGFGAFKIKIGRAPAEDLMRVRMARRLIGEAPLLAVDANGNYTADLALQSMRRIVPFNVHWYEEPLAPQDWGGYAELARRAPLPVATGEALYTVFDFRRVVDGRLASVLQPDLALCGGFETARAVAMLAGAEHLRLSPHCWGTGVGLAAAVQWVAALASYPHADHVPFPTLVEYDVGPNPLRDELLTEKLQLRDGMLDVPTGPGLGIALDPEALKRFGTG
jgi:D-galactarolactone cycloisomerase